MTPLIAQVGIDVTTHVVNNLIGDPAKGYLGVRMEGADLKIMDDFVAAGLLGKKTGKGFFDHSDKKAKVSAPECPCLPPDCVRCAMASSDGMISDGILR
jgi:enoyl-CoA hydratase/long-chain 3-hydroxyacyl-CoA dehydrogenase